MFKVGSSGNPLALLAVVAITAAIGALIALPALRLKGLYLALATMAFALFLEKAVFPNIDSFKDGDAAVGRLHIGVFRSTATERTWSSWRSCSACSALGSSPFAAASSAGDSRR